MPQKSDHDRTEPTSQSPWAPDATIFQPPSVAEPKGFLKRYFIVTLLVASWCAVWLFLDGMYGFWIFVIFPILLPLAGLAIYLLHGLVVSMRAGDDLRTLSVIFGPLAAGMLVLAIAAFIDGLGFTPDYIMFLKQKDKFLARVAEPGAGRPLMLGDLRTTGFWWACTSVTTVIYDPGHQIAALPAQRDDEWKKRMAEIVNNNKCGNGSARVSRLEGDFYAIRLD